MDSEEPILTEAQKRRRLAEFMQDRENGVVFCQDANGFMGRDGLHIIDVLLSSDFADIRNPNFYKAGEFVPHDEYARLLELCACNNMFIVVIPGG
jgi:hypothetical protein